MHKQRKPRISSKCVILSMLFLVQVVLLIYYLFLKPKPVPPILPDMSVVVMAPWRDFGHVFTLADSLWKHDDATKMHIFVLDSEDAPEQVVAHKYYRHPQITIVPFQHVFKIKKAQHLVQQMIFKYGLGEELETSIRPYIMRYMLDTLRIAKVCFLPRKTLVLEPLAEALALLNHYAMIIAPFSTSQPTSSSLNDIVAFNMQYAEFDAFLKHYSLRVVQYLESEQQASNNAAILSDWVLDAISTLPLIYVLGQQHQDKQIPVPPFSTNNGILFRFNQVAMLNFDKVKAQADLHRRVYKAEQMLEKYNHLLQAQDASTFAQLDWSFATFDNGAPITDTIRGLYHAVSHSFPHPFVCKSKSSFFDYIHAPLHQETSTPRFLIALYESRPKLKQELPWGINKQQCALFKWFIAEGAAESALNHPSYTRPIQLFINEHCSFGVNVAGFPRGEFGIAETSRSTVRALFANQVSLSVANLPGGHSHNDNLLEERFGVTIENTFPYSITIVHDDIHNNPFRVNKARFNQTYKIGMWNWESSVIPDAVIPNYQHFDEIWAPSTYCAFAFASASIGKPVIRMPYVVELLSENIQPNREKFGIPENSFVFMIQFDIGSCETRKNPMAVIHAFVQAFSEDKPKDVMLIVKTMNIKLNVEAKERYYRTEKELNAKGLNVRFINERFDRADSFSLKKSVDCFISLHHSEGFGFNIAEAMYLGKPVIATAYSANMDFMNHYNSYPVNYTSVSLNEEVCHAYAKGTIWADPDVSHAALLMRHVFYNQEEARKVGLLGQEEIRRHYSAKSIGAMILRRVEFINKYILKND